VTTPVRSIFRNLLIDHSLEVRRLARDGARWWIDGAFVPRCGSIWEQIPVS